MANQMVCDLKQIYFYHYKKRYEFTGSARLRIKQKQQQKNNRSFISISISIYMDEKSVMLNGQLNAIVFCVLLCKVLF